MPCQVRCRTVALATLTISTGHVGCLSSRAVASTRTTATVAVIPSAQGQEDRAMLTPNVVDRMLTLSRAMDQALADGWTPTSAESRRTQVWLPVVDCYETENTLVIEADLP